MRQVEVEAAVAAQRPEWVVLVVTRRADGFVDVMPAGWVMRASGMPPMFAIAVNRANYTNDLIREAAEFVLAFPSVRMSSVVSFCGSHTGRDTDKVAATGLRLQPATVLATPLLAEAFVAFECRLRTIAEAGDHTVFIGEVVVAHAGDHPGPLVNFGDHFGLAVAAPR